MTKTKGFRQGDVLVIPVGAIPASAKPVDHENGRVILAHGEATGHHHSFGHNQGVTMFRDDGGASYIQVTAPTNLVHQEHTALQATPGTYEVRRQRTYVSGLVRRVAD
jgi:hypothetical protein